MEIDEIEEFLSLFVNAIFSLLAVKISMLPFICEDTCVVTVTILSTNHLKACGEAVVSENIMDANSV